MFRPEIGTTSVTTEFPLWFTAIAALSLTIAVGCAVFVTVDVIRRRQPMAVMNVVWPITMLFGSVVWLVFYLRRGRAARTGDTPIDRHRRMAGAVAIGASHCGAGCAMGDLIGEFALVAFPPLAAVFGLGWLFSDEIFAAWALDFVLAFVIGIAFQYFAIAPMREVSVRAGIWQAVKADTFSISAWQVGMYGFMALAQFLLFPALFGGRADVVSPEFWFAMQLAMVAGFATSYPVNWVLIRTGVKEKM